MKARVRGTGILTAAQENQLDIPAKRGLFIVEYLTDKVSFNDRGNEISITLYLNGKTAKSKDH